jgi:bacterioferritin-associated ferredoxin
MISFKEFASGLNLSPTLNPSVQVSLKATGHVLYLKFDSKDILTSASYTGPIDTWLGSLCSLILGKTLFDMTHLSTQDWDKAFASDQTFWDLKSEIEEDFYFAPLELLRSALDVYRGREYLYKEPEALICRCFGIRENDILDYIRSTDNPTSEGLAKVSKAAMGCRSCVPQITNLLSINSAKSLAKSDKEREALICRCFSVRENDILDYIRSTDNPTLEGLSKVSKAATGCRSCVPQITKLFSSSSPKSKTGFYKEKPRADWLLEIDDRLNRFPEASEWGMEIERFQGTQVTITFNKKFSQTEEEVVSAKLQDFLGEALDPDLSFFLIRARQRSNA